MFLKVKPQFRWVFLGQEEDKVLPDSLYSGTKISAKAVLYPRGTPRHSEDVHVTDLKIVAKKINCSQNNWKTFHDPPTTNKHKSKS